MVFEIRISPVPSLLIVVAPINVTGRVRVISALLVCRMPDRETTDPPPDPVSENGPSISVELPGCRVKVPEWLTDMEPLPVVTILPVIVNPVPIRLIPVMPLVLRFPRRLVIPAPADWMIEEAVIAGAAILLALVN